MASLALLVSIIFLSVLIIGPISYLLSSFPWMPNLIKWIMAIVCIFIGGWVCFLPIPFLRALGLIDIGIGLKIISDSTQKKSDA
jgi:hypothetical protein